MGLYKGRVEEVLQRDFVPNRAGMASLLELFEQGYAELDDPYLEFEDYIMDQLTTDMIMLFLDYVDEDEFNMEWELEYKEAERVVEDEFNTATADDYEMRFYRRKWTIFLVLTSL